MSVLTIPTPNTDRSLLTLAELRSLAGVTDNSRDVELQAMGAYVSAMITRACHVVVASIGAIPPTLRFEPVTETFRHTEYNTRETLALSRQPVTSIISVTENDKVLATTDYEMDSGLLRRRSGNVRVCWPFYGWPTGTVEVAYEAGWATVPDDLKYCAIIFAQAQIAMGDRDPTLKRKVTQGVSEYEWWVSPADTMLPAAVTDMLELGGYVRKWGWMA